MWPVDHPSARAGLSRNSVTTALASGLGIIPQPAGLAELVLGDRNKQSVMRSGSRYPQTSTSYHHQICPEKEPKIRITLQNGRIPLRP